MTTSCTAVAGIGGDGCRKGKIDSAIAHTNNAAQKMNTTRARCRRVIPIASLGLQSAVPGSRSVEHCNPAGQRKVPQTEFVILIAFPATPKEILFDIWRSERQAAVPGEEISAYDEKIRQLLGAVRNGDRNAFNSLIEAVGHELRKLSAYRLRQQPESAQILQTTALVNEVVLRLLQMLERSGSKFPESRVHLLALTSHMMRCTLADYARKRKLPSTSLEDTESWSQQDVETLLTLDEALRELERSSGEIGRRRSEALELYLFGGLNYREIADKLGVSDDVARHDCQIALARVREAFAGKSD